MIMLSTFGNLGCCMGCCGFFVRNFPRVIRSLHLLVLLLVLIQFAILFTVQECQNAIHSTPDNIEGTPGLMYEDGVFYNLINICGWFVLHYCLPCIKSCIDQEAYLYEPYDEENGLAGYLICEFFGP